MTKIRKRNNQVPHLTQDATWESNEKHNQHHKQNSKGQPLPSSIKLDNVDLNKLITGMGTIIDPFAIAIFY